MAKSNGQELRVIVSTGGNALLEQVRLSGAVVDREETILRMCTGKRVLHFGAADWPFTAEQHRTGRLLHERIAGVAATVCGVDLSAAGVDYLRRVGFSNTVVADVERLSEVAFAGTFDVIVAGEIIEHLSNPGLCLVGLMGECFRAATLVITVPNAFSAKAFLRACCGRELVHPEHVAYFSPTTLIHLCSRYGYAVTSAEYYVTRPHTRGRRLLSLPLSGFIHYLAPSISDGLILAFKRA